LVTRRNALVAAPLALLVAGATVAVVRSDPGPELTLAAQVTEGSVNKMITSKGVVSAAKTANIGFKAANSVKTVDVKVGDKVKKGQKLGEQDNGGARFALLVASGTLSQQQAALDQILNDVNPAGLQKIADRAKDVADQAERNIEIRRNADIRAYNRLKELVRYDIQAIKSAKVKLDFDKCTEYGTSKYGVTASELTAAIPSAPATKTSRDQLCAADYAALQATRKTYFQDRTAFINAKKNIKVNEGVLRSTWRGALQTLDTARNTANIARVNRPTQILAQRALVANAQSNVAAAQSTVKNSYVYSPVDGVVTAISGTVGEFSAGGNNLVPTTPVAPGSAGRIPSTGLVADADRNNPSNTNGSLLSSVNPSGGAFMQISDLNSMSVVATYNEADVAGITNGSLAKVSFDALPGKDVDGSVTAVSPIGVPGPEGKTQYYATVLLNKTIPELKSGMSANVSVSVATVQNKAFVVPTSAVRGGDEPYVMVPGPDGAPQKRTIVKGAIGDDNTEVKEGIKPGETVLVPETGRLPVASADSTVPQVAADRPMEVIFDAPKKVDPPPPLPVPAVTPLPAPAAAADPGVGAMPDLGSDPTLEADPSLTGADPSGGGDGSLPMGGPAGPAAGGSAAQSGGINPFAPQPAPAPAN
jgi:multidrug efflux pump subunit AcrA (membrane-fusion protein)